MRLDDLLPAAFRPRPAPPAPPAGGVAASAMGRDTATPRTRPGISGAFLQLDGASETTDWAAKLQAMKRLGMDTVIIQSEGPGMERVLEAADALGMKVWVGAPLHEDGWYTGQLWPPFLKRQGAVAAKETGELAKRVASHPSCVGIYLPYETNGLASPWAMGDFYGGMAAAARAARPDLQVMISPYTNLVPGVAASLPAGMLAWWWNIVLGRAKLDVLAWQDGVGASEAQLGRVDHDLGALQRACEANGVHLWANLEAFKRTTPLNQPFSAEAAPIERFERQLEASAPYAERVITFDFNHYLDPEAGPSQKVLYDAYLGLRLPP